jgi:hypothetical protein
VHRIAMFLPPHRPTSVRSTGTYFRPRLWLPCQIWSTHSHTHTLTRTAWPPFHRSHDEMALLARPAPPIMSVVAHFGRSSALAGPRANFLSSGIRPHPRLSTVYHARTFQSFNPLRNSLGTLCGLTPRYQMLTFL